MKDNYAEARAFLIDSVRTYRRDLEAYMTEMAELNGQATRGEIDPVSFAYRSRAVETRYAGRIHEDDCHRFETAEEYRDFLDLMKRVSPHAAEELDYAMEHEGQHAQALKGIDGVKVEYAYWLLREEDGTVSGWPCIIGEGAADRYIEARRSSVGAPSELSPFDRMELGQDPQRED